MGDNPLVMRIPTAGALLREGVWGHVSPSGDLEPCPASQFSDANLLRVSLKDALQSSFLDKIRRHHDILTETDGGCALRANREWVQALVTKP